MLLCRRRSAGSASASSRGPSGSCPHGPFEEEREPIASSDEQLQALDAELVASEEADRPAQLLVRLLAGGGSAPSGLAALFPIRSLGPRPGDGLKESPFTAGDQRSSTSRASGCVRRTSRSTGSSPCSREGSATTPNGPTLLIHLRPGQNSPSPGRDDWTVDDLVAYSKLCTHIGCPVGLYQAQSGLLLCPCHQSTFDVARRHCNPIFGPATRSLPQLPIGIDADGYLIATGDFSDPGRPWLLGPGPLMAGDPASPTASLRWARPSRRRRQGGPQGARQDLPRPLVVHARARWPSTASSSSSLTGVFLTLFFYGQPDATTYAGSYAPLQGVEMSQAYESAIRLSLRRAGRHRHAPDPPLGRARSSSPPSRPTWSASSSPAPSAARGSSTG